MASWDRGKIPTDLKFIKPVPSVLVTNILVIYATFLMFYWNGNFYVGESHFSTRQ